MFFLRPGQCFEPTSVIKKTLGTDSPSALTFLFFIHLHIIAFFFNFSIFSFYKTQKLLLSPHFSLFHLYSSSSTHFFIYSSYLVIFLLSFFIFHHFVRHFYSGSHINSQHISHFFRFTYDVFILSHLHTLVIPTITIFDTYIFFR